MCLNISDTKYNKKVLDSLKKRAKNGKVTCWKFVLKQGDVIKSYYRGSSLKLGQTYISNRKSKALFKYESRKKIVSQGIHIYTYPKEESECFRLRVVCDLKDLVACGRFSQTGSAVFMKVFIPQQEPKYVKATDANY